MFGLIRKNRTLIGIDIGSTSVKLIELSHGHADAPSGLRVEHCALEPLPANAVAEKKIVESEAVGEAIARAVRRSGTNTKHAAVAVAGSAVITKTIMMPAGLDDAELESQIALEADQYIPYPLEEVNLDFEVIGPAQSDPGMVEVLLAASRTENVDDRVNALETAGLVPAIVDVEAYAMENACALLLDEGGGATVALADVGSATTTLHVLHEGRIVYTREQNFGGQQLRDEVQRRYGFSREQAAQKILDGDVAEGYDMDVLAPFKEALAQQIGRALQFFYSGTSYSKVDRLVISGGAASLPRLDQLVGERLRIPTTIANPFARMVLAPTLDAQALMREAPGMMLALGLALRGVD
ncbi:pilus assembly protein PilM [Marichromatium bheemlicum]|uniref:Pilus assembly protein PilM n=1 Tax=Marichromatium bheemlicum TaxID=365339 RepID=A0ABX1I519_9GAMM|nr:pilus assembly protein PilM [Marichromatium bheemlicum]NKN32662.1 pilus assembly protein PilM [Marichromatium bheemlicum]